LADLQRTVYPHKWSTVAVGQAQREESSPVNDRRSTTAPVRHTTNNASGIIQFASWQHPAMGHVARFAVPSITSNQRHMISHHCWNTVIPAARVT